MRPKLLRVLALVLAGVALYFIVRASVPSRQAGTQVEQDTMCLASRIGLPCNPH